MDGVMRSGEGVLTRLLHIGGAPIVVHGWQRRDGSVAIRAVAADPDAELPPHALEEAITRMRFSLAVDDDLTPSTRSSSATPSSARRSAGARGSAPSAGRSRGRRWRGRSPSSSSSRRAPRKSRSGSSASGAGRAPGRERGPSTARSPIFRATPPLPAWPPPNWQAATSPRLVRSRW